MGIDDGSATDGAVIALSFTDPAAFALIFDRHFATIHRYLARRVGSDVADDLAGDVFRVAFERRETFDRRRPNARPWLYGIATNLLYGERRHERRRLQAMDRAASLASVPLGVDRHAGRVPGLFDRLRPPHRMLI